MSARSLAKSSDQVRIAYHSFNTLWEEESVVQRVHRVIGLNSTFFLQQDGPGV